MRTCAAIIFDFDGVIVESENIKAMAFAALYGEHSAEAGETASRYHLANGGVSRRKKIRHLHRTLLGQELSEDDLAALGSRFSSLVEDAVVDCPWVPGAPEALSAQNGRLLFVASGTPHDELVRIVARRGIAPLFREVFGSPPEKAITVRSIVERHRLEPATVLMVGDAMADYAAARESGIRFVGRVAEDAESPFPPGTPVIRDLWQLVP